MKPTFKYLLGAIVALSLADALISQLLVYLGVGHEVNPFLKSLSPVYVVLLKLVGALLAVFLLWDIGRRRPRIGTISAVVIVVFLSGILMWNLRLFLAP